MRTLAIAAITALGFTFTGTNEADAQVRVRVGFGSGYSNYGRYYQPGFSGRRVIGVPGHYHWHDTSHYDVYPGYKWRHGNHYHYEPSRVIYHRQGHWDYHGPSYGGHHGGHHRGH